jgi:hypothetical protein
VKISIGVKLKKNLNLIKYFKKKIAIKRTMLKLEKPFNSINYLKIIMKRIRMKS